MNAIGYASATTPHEARVLRAMLQRIGCVPAAGDVERDRPQLRELLAGVEPDQVLIVSDLPALGANPAEIAARLSEALIGAVATGRHRHGYRRAAAGPAGARPAWAEAGRSGSCA